jgi:hypothetical protein
MIWVYLAAAFYVGLFTGIIIQRWLVSRKSYSGIIQVTHTEDKTLFSLELGEDPEMIAYRNEVIFKVVTTEEEADRE